MNISYSIFLNMLFIFTPNCGDRENPIIINVVLSESGSQDPSISLAGQVQQYARLRETRIEQFLHHVNSKRLCYFQEMVSRKKAVGVWPRARVEVDIYLSYVCTGIRCLPNDLLHNFFYYDILQMYESGFICWLLK